MKDIAQEIKRIRKEHNLTHYDIVWLSVDLDTCQIFVEFDCNNVDFQ